MTKIEKILEKFKKIPADLTWEELAKVLSFLGYKEFVGGASGGSRRKFVHEKYPMINLHKPHPKNVVKKYALRQIIEQLEKENLL